MKEKQIMAWLLKLRASCLVGYTINLESLKKSSGKIVITGLTKVTGTHLVKRNFSALIISLQIGKQIKHSRGEKMATCSYHMLARQSNVLFISFSMAAMEGQDLGTTRSEP